MAAAVVGVMMIATITTTAMLLAPGRNSWAILPLLIKPAAPSRVRRLRGQRNHNASSCRKFRLGCDADQSHGGSPVDTTRADGHAGANRLNAPLAPGNREPR